MGGEDFYWILQKPPFSHKKAVCAPLHHYSHSCECIRQKTVSMVSTRSSTARSRAKLSKPLKAKAGKDLTTLQRAAMPDFEVDVPETQPTAEMTVMTLDAANMVPHHDMTVDSTDHSVTADDTDPGMRSGEETDLNTEMGKAYFNIELDAEDNMQVADADPFMPICVDVNDICEFWDDDLQESEEEVLTEEWGLINNDLDVYTRNISVGVSAPFTPIGGAASSEFWDSDHQESLEEEMAATCDGLSSRLEVRLGDFLIFETIPGWPVSETRYILRSNTAKGIEMVFRNMLELFHVIPSIRNLLSAISDGDESRYTQFYLGGETVLSFHPHTMMFSCSKYIINNEGVCALTRPAVVIHPEEVETLLALLTLHLAYITPELESTLPCTMSHPSVVDELLCDFCTHLH